MEKSDFLLPKARKYKVAGAKVGLSPRCFTNLLWLRRVQKTLPSTLIFQRILLNLNDEILDFFIDDENFDGAFLKGHYKEDDGRLVRNRHLKKPIRNSDG